MILQDFWNNVKLLANEANNNVKNSLHLLVTS